MYYVVKIYSNNSSIALCPVQIYELEALIHTYIYIFATKQSLGDKQLLSFSFFIFFLFFFLLLFSLFLFFSPFLVAIAKYRFSESPPDSVSRADQIADGSLVGIQSRGRCCGQQTGRRLLFVLFLRAFAKMHARATVVLSWLCHGRH